MSVLTADEIERKKMISEVVGSNLKRLRLDKGYSGEFIARELHVSSRTYYGWEAGELRFSIPVDALVLAKDVLQIPIDKFFEGLQNAKQSKPSSKEEKEFRI